MEFIARHTLQDGNIGAFSMDDIHYVSEIGLVTDDVAALSQDLSTTFHLKPYHGQSDRFAALGSEAGLLLCFKKGGAAAFGQGRKRQVYKTAVQLTSHYNGMFENQHFRING